MARPVRVMTLRQAGAITLVGLMLGGAVESAAQECTVEQVEKWLKHRRTNLGVQAFDSTPILAPDIVPLPDRPVRDSCPSEVDFSLDQEGRAVDGIHSWVFASPCKLAVCGKPRSFEENRGIVLLSGEYDLNNNLEFDADFRKDRLGPYLCQPLDARGNPLVEKSRLEPNGTPVLDRINLALQEPRLCFGPTTSLHVEITPPGSFRPLFRRLWVEDPPWGWLRWRSVLYEKTACVYGPFVADTAHATLAEIHPVQMYWWNERAKKRSTYYEADGPYALFVLQDGSNRYTQPHHFVLSKAPPKGSTWKAWAGGPIDGVFEIPFYSPIGHPPRFHLTPYEYEGHKAPAPRSEPCIEERVTEIESTSSLVGKRTTVATACNGTRADRSAAVKLELATICECHPTAPEGWEKRGWKKEDWCPSPGGFLGTVTLSARTGSTEEWREGAVGLLLSDSRAAERRAAFVREEKSAPEVPQDLSETSMSESVRLSWRAVPGEKAWSELPVVPEELGQAEDVTRSLFREAKWPAHIESPMTSVWRLGAVELRAEVVVPYLRDKDRGETKVVSTTFGAVATSLNPGANKKIEVQVSPASNSKTEGQLILGELGNNTFLMDPFRVDITVQVKARYPAPTGLLVESQGMASKPTADRKLQGIWTLWTHGLGSHPSALWLHATRVLCDEYQRSGSEGSADAVRDSIAHENVRIATQRVLKDEVVSVAELTLLVEAVRRSCRAAAATPEADVSVAEAEERGGNLETTESAAGSEVGIGSARVHRPRDSGELRPTGTPTRSLPRLLPLNSKAHRR